MISSQLIINLKRTNKGQKAVNPWLNPGIRPGLEGTGQTEKLRNLNFKTWGGGLLQPVKNGSRTKFYCSKVSLTLYTGNLSSVALLFRILLELSCSTRKISFLHA